MRYEDHLLKLLDLPVRIFVSTSGAGAGIQQILWDPPGASRYLAGAHFPYSPEMSTEFLGFRPPRFVCLEEAIDMAFVSYMKADSGDRTQRFIGLGLTASVATNVEHKGDHRIHAAVVTKDRVLATEVTLPKEGPYARGRDGNIANTIGMELILAAAGLIDEPTRVAYWTATDGQCLKDISEMAREHFFKRPLFTRYGKREEVPKGNLTLFPGNFNPPHDGHFANAGEDAVFQITANPPHKAALTLTEMLERVRHFRGKRDLLFTEGGALYLDKARRFPGSTFILGTDACERMLDPKWGIEVRPLLTEFADLGTKFKVATRGTDEFARLLIPDAFRWMFTELPKTPFANLSSTQIRERV
jgi:hypothetical protein